MKHHIRLRFGEAGLTKLLASHGAKFPATIHDQLIAADPTKATALLDSPDFALVRALKHGRQNFVITDPRLPDNPIVYASQGFMDLTGYTLEEVSRPAPQPWTGAHKGAGAGGQDGFGVMVHTLRTEPLSTQLPTHPLIHPPTHPLPALSLRDSPLRGARRSWGAIAASCKVRTRTVRKWPRCAKPSRQAATCPSAS